MYLIYAYHRDNDDDGDDNDNLSMDYILIKKGNYYDYGTV